jgi:hypothetical protein
MQELSERTRAIIRKMFPAEQHEEIAWWLEAACGNNLPFFGDLDAVGLERIRFAVLKLSSGDLQALLRAVQCAQSDWRDAFVAAGFGDDVTEHDRWANGYLAQSSATGTTK